MSHTQVNDMANISSDDSSSPSNPPKITPTKDLDTILEDYANAVYMSTEENGSIEDVYKAKTEVEAWATQQVVEARINELGQMLGMYIPIDPYIKHRIAGLQSQQENTNA